MGAQVIAIDNHPDADYYDGMNELELAAQWGLEGKGE
ncbi:hypothetical protein KIV66_gp47 [Mycobacterium phage MyraDee]|uniref:Uncharacterized protein n=1 Tax=Mycobacterium phage MyraDee TaxID=2024303 RepID=A0A222Z0S2_9CAUD|nr:hypothetical protein KIV66_gp47 [Mycobacterium phage MyraDee]ASR77155.1 hypothetical protein SEA_MYRADEE_47 [Mycobacterium phage MyraDee]